MDSQRHVTVTGWHVDGFGQLTDHAVDGLGPGLTVFHGPNEVGKTTLMAYIRRMLYGFPDRRTKLGRDAAYAPVRGGEPGGRLHLDVGEPVTVERLGKRVRVVLGETGERDGGEEVLAALLAGTDADVFRSVYAFGLDELATFSSLDADGVREALFSAGIRGAGTSARTARAALDERAAQRYLPRGRKHEVLRLGEELDQVEGELRQVRAEIGGYSALCREEDAAHHEVDVRRAALRSIAEDDAHLARLLDTWPTWQRVVSARADLGDIDEVAPTTAADLEDLARAESVLEAATERLRSAEEGLATAAGQVGAPVVVPDPDVRARVHALAQRRGDVERLRTDHASIEARSRQVAATSQRTALELGVDHNVLRGVATGAAVQERVRSAATDIAAASEAVRLAQVRLEESVTESPVDDGAREVLDAAVLDLKVAREHAAHAAATDVPGRIATISGPVLAAAATWAGVAGAWVVALVMATLAGVTAVAASVRSRRVAATRARRHAREVVAAQRVAELIAAPTDGSNPGVLGDLDHLDHLDDLVREHRAEARARTRLALEGRDVGAADALRNANDRQREASERWSEVAAAIGLPVSVPPARAIEVVAAAGRMVEADLELARLGEQLYRHALELRAISDDLDELAAAHEDVVVSGDLLSDLVRLEAVDRDLSERADAAAGRSAAVLALDTARASRDRAAEDVRMAEGALLAVCDRFAVSTPAAARAVAEGVRRVRDLEQRVELGEEELRERLGTGQEARRIREQLATGEVVAWERQRAELEQQRMAAEAEHEASVRQAADLQRRCTELSTDARLAELETRRGVLIATREDAVRQWAVLHLAAGLVDHTLTRFERERQPRVLTNAAAAFARVTGGRYTGLIQRDAELTVRCADGQELPTSVLSRGAAESLYLCLRLALAEEQADRTVALPFVMDDVLVNVDPERARRLASELARIAQRHQVLYFTCHPHVVALLREADPCASEVALVRTSQQERITA